VINGLDSAVIGAQSRLLEAAVETGVPRFIPFDLSIDYRGIRAGSNRNLQLRRDFAQKLGSTAIHATSVLTGAFTDMLTGEAPMSLRSRHRVLFCSDPDVDGDTGRPPARPRNRVWPGHPNIASVSA
jgi:hypothetical protein